MKEKATTREELLLAVKLKEKHMERYSGARVEIERLIQIGINDPKELMTTAFDAMDNRKVSRNDSDSCNYMSLASYFCNFL